MTYVLALVVDGVASSEAFEHLGDLGERTQALDALGVPWQARRGDGSLLSESSGW